MNSGLGSDKYLEPAPKKVRISRVGAPSDGLDGSIRSSNVYEGSFMGSRNRDSDGDYDGWVFPGRFWKLLTDGEFTNSSNTTPNSLEDGSMGISYATLTSEPISKRIASPINGQSKGSSSGNDQPRPRSSKGGNRTNGTTQSNNNNLTSSSYDTVMTSGGDEGFRESLSKNGSTKGGFRWVQRHRSNDVKSLTVFFFFLAVITRPLSRSNNVANIRLNLTKITPNIESCTSSWIRRAVDLPTCSRSWPMWIRRSGDIR